MTGKSECPECESEKLTTDHRRGEVYCEGCGLVVEENLVDLGVEYREYGDGHIGKFTRCGPPASYRRIDKGLRSWISTRNVDYRGNKISPQMRALMRELRKWHGRC